MIALGPAEALKRVGAKGNDDYRHEQSEKGDAVDSEDRNVARHFNGIRDGGNSRIHLRLDAKIGMAGGDARDHHAVVTTSFGPPAVTIVARVVADFPPEVPRLPRVLIDERVIEIHPLVSDRCPSLYLDG